MLGLNLKNVESRASMATGCVISEDFEYGRQKEDEGYCVERAIESDYTHNQDE
jgi:hypothetical protein